MHNLNQFQFYFQKENDTIRWVDGKPYRYSNPPQRQSLKRHLHPKYELCLTKNDLCTISSLSLEEDLWSLYNETVKNMCGAWIIYGDGMSDWMLLPCDEPVQNPVVLCEITEKRTLSEDVSLTRSYMECPRNMIAIDSECYIEFQSMDLTLPHKELRDIGNYTYCRRTQNPLPLSQEHYVRLLGYLQTWNPDRCLEWCYVTMMTHFACYHLRLEYTANKFTDITSTANSLLIQHTVKVNVSIVCRYSDYQCSDGTCILSYQQCDGFLDCSDGKDEENCSMCKGLSDSLDTHFCRHQCLSPICYCSQHYYQCLQGGCIPGSKLCDRIRDCADGSDENSCSYNNFRESRPEVDGSFMCGKGSIIKLNYIDDYNIDCANADDEQIEAITSTPKRTTCTFGSSPCHNGYSRNCYPRQKTCLLELTKDDISFCRAGNHLRRCSRHQCPTNFKCNHSYCIPTHGVCNGIQDCPHGEDEQLCGNGTIACKGLLKCQKDNVCVHPDYLCDEKVDCPLSGDDEKLCSLSQCPGACVCLGEAYMCTIEVVLLNYSWLSVRSLYLKPPTHVPEKDIVPQLLHNSPKLMLLDASGLGWENIEAYTFRNQYNLVTVNLLNNRLHILKSMCLFGLYSLRYISLMGNKIHKISDGAFASLIQVRTLDLSNQSIHVFDNFAFWGLLRTETFNLSYNRITTIKRVHFDGMPSLHTLDISQNRIRAADFVWHMFEITNLKFVFVDNPLLCTLAGIKGQCFSQKKHPIAWNPLTNRFTKFCTLFVICTVAFIKLVGILYQVKRVYRLSSLYESSIAVFTIAESWICVYLTTLYIALENNVNYSAYYMYAWPSSPICSFLRVISFAGVHLTLVNFLIISVMRYFKIVHAVHRYQFQRSILILPSLASVTASLLISQLILFLQNVETTTLDPACLLLFSWSQGPIFWAFNTYFLCVNCLLTMGIIVLCFRTASALDASDKIISSNMDSNRKAQKRIISTRIILQCSSGIMACVAMSIFQLLSGHFTDYSWHVWFAITVVPISLLANFFLQIVFTPAFINDLTRTKEYFQRIICPINA